VQQAVINVSGELKKSVNLTPFNVQNPVSGSQDPLFNARYADDVIYGGLGNDWLHGGAGDDAISGAEALPMSAALVYGDDGRTDAARTDGVVISLGYNAPLVMSAAEALQGRAFRLLGFQALKAEEFAQYDEYAALRRIQIGGQEFFLNFEAVTSGGSPIEDGNDRIFGDLGNDWVVPRYPIRRLRQ
jgi:Ca2+-binding RTX toxin-like protein